MKVSLFTNKPRSAPNLGDAAPIIQFGSKWTSMKSRQETPVIRETNAAGYEGFSRFVLLGYNPANKRGEKWSRVLDVQDTSLEVNNEWEGSDTQTITFNTNIIQEEEKRRRGRLLRHC